MGGVMIEQAAMFVPAAAAGFMARCWLVSSLIRRDEGAARRRPDTFVRGRSGHSAGAQTLLQPFHQGAQRGAIRKSGAAACAAETLDAQMLATTELAP